MLRHNPHWQLSDAGHDALDQATQKTFARGSWDVDDVVRRQRQIFRALLLDRVEIDGDLFSDCRSWFLTQHAYLVFARVLLETAGHSKGSCQSDRLAPRNRQRHEDVSDK